MSAWARRTCFPWDDVKAFLLQANGAAVGTTLELDTHRVGAFLSSSKSYWIKCRFTSDGEPMQTHDFLVKQSPYAQLEDRWLRLVRSILGGTSLERTVPRAIGVLPNHNIVITDFFAGTRNLHAEMIKSAIPFSHPPHIALLSRVAGSAGAWLAAFQRSLDEGRRASLAEEIPEVRERVEEVTLFSGAEKNRVADVLSAASRQLGPLPIVLSHGDFAPRNVLFREEQVAVIDWEMVPEQSLGFLRDVHHFLIALSKRTQDWFMEPALIDSCQRHFTEQYVAACPFAAWLEPAWRPSRLIALLMVLSRQWRTVARQPIRARITGKSKFIKYLVGEIRAELDNLG